MARTTKRTLALLLVLVQLITLLPVLSLRAEAAEPASDAASPQESALPVLNETIVGTVKFQSFNFLGDNATGSDGVDYTSTFYYSDDFFSPSAIHETASTSLKWSDLSATETALASVSFDLTVATYASNENNVLRATTRTWDNTDYPGKDKNARSLLEQCGFTNIESFGTYDQAPTNDSIAYVIGSKQITVWDETTQSNRTFTLVSVSVRGAGYGAEWASNVTIGDPATGRIGSNGRHWGFDKAAQDVCAGVQNYLAAHNITADVKYWVTGFSRAGATANLVAGYITDGAASTYHTRPCDVYGYTWECPKGASTSENALNYKNIHNIVNAMDAVPKLSPDAFQHQRLGVDYVMPYYKNTTTAENETYYMNMREVLKTIAVGAYNYKGEYYTEDPLIRVTNPSQYPYNRTMKIRTITAGQLISDALNGTLTDNFGTVDATGSDQRIPAQHIDEFIDDLIDVFLVSGAWSGKIGAGNTTTPMNNRTKFIAGYQNHFRNVLGYLLDFTGPAFMGVIDQLLDAVGDQLALSNTVDNAGLGLAFLNFYNYPTSTYKLGVPPFIDPWVGSPGWVGKTRKDVLIQEAQPVVRNVVRNLTSGFVDPQGITRSQFEASMDELVAVVVNLYADELSRYNSNYFGTSLYYMWQILCTHEQEVVMSWIKSVDQNHINRGYRTFTVPVGTDVKVYEFRSQYGETLSFDTEGPLVAEFKNGAAVTNLDRRISVTVSGPNMVIRYPSLLDLRFDVTSDTAIDDLQFQLGDYRTKTIASALSDGAAQYDPAAADAANYQAFTSSGARYWNNYSDSTVVPLMPGDTVSVTARHTTAFNETDSASDMFYNMRRGCTVTWTDANGETVLETDSPAPEGTMPVYNAAIPTKAEDSESYYVFSGWTTPLAPVTGSTTYVAKYDAKPLYYNVKLYYQVGDEAECVYTSGDYRYTKSVKLTAEDEYTKDGATYYFSHWDVDGTAYPAKQITVHPGEGGITVNAKAVYVENAADAMSKGEAFVQIVKVETETIGPDTARLAHKWVFTLSQSVPAGTVEETGFVVSMTNPNPTLGEAGVIKAASGLKTATSTFTARVNVTGLESQPLYVRAYLTYNGVTIYSDEPAVVYTFPTV